MAEWLLERGADLNLQDYAWVSRPHGSLAPRTYTALMYAATNATVLAHVDRPKYGHDAMVALLLEKGAELNLKSTEGKTAKDLATEANKATVVVMLEEAERNPGQPMATYLKVRGR